MSASQNVAKTVDDYIARYPDDIQKRLAQIRSTIRSVAPEAVESISYAIPAFKVNGKPLIYFAGYTKHIGAYPLPEEPSPELEAEIAPYVAGKGTLQFPHNEPLPLDLIERAVVRRKQYITATE